MFIKVAGIGWREYWTSGWNKLDFSLVCLSIVDLAFSYLQSSFLRIIKVLKAQKLLKVCPLRITLHMRSPLKCLGWESRKYARRAGPSQIRVETLTDTVPTR